MSDNPITSIEDEKAQTDLGVFGFRIYRGARDEGATRFEALAVVCAFFFGMFKGNQADPE